MDHGLNVRHKQSSRHAFTGYIRNTKSDLLICKWRYVEIISADMTGRLPGMGYISYPSMGGIDLGIKPR
jgi:hypothetical protein